MNRRKEKIKQFLLVVISLFAGMGAYILVQGLPRQDREYMVAAIALAFSLILWISIMTFFLRGGETLVQVTPTTNRFVIGILVAIAFLIQAWVSIKTCFFNPDSPLSLYLKHGAFMFFWATLGINATFIGMENWFVRQKGIVTRGRFLPWKKIMDFEWRQDHPRSLTLLVKKPSASLLKVYLRVPHDQREEIMSILKLKVTQNY